MYILVEVLIVCLVGLLGNTLMKIGVKNFGSLSFSTFAHKDFYIKLFTTWDGWIVALSLLIAFVSKMLTLTLVSHEKFGVVFALIAPVSLLLTLAVGFTVFHEVYTWREVLGVLCACLAVFLVTE